MSEKVQELVEKIKVLTLVEAAELKKALEDEFGVTAAAPMMMAGCSRQLLLQLRLKNKLNSMLFFKNAGATKD